MTRLLTISVYSFCLFIMLESALFSFEAMAAQQSSGEKEQSVAPQADKNDDSLVAILGQETPLRVPVYPRRDSEDKPLPEGADLRDQYILLDDGSVISMADWVLGALNRSNIDRNLSDFERRLFLGEVARNMLQEGRLLGARPGVPLPTPAPLETPLSKGLSEGLLGFLPESLLGVLASRIPGPPEKSLVGNGFDVEQNITDFIGFNDPIGTSDPTEINGGRVNFLKTNFERSFEHNVVEWQYRGAQLNMLNDFKAKLKREGRGD